MEIEIDRLKAVVIKQKSKINNLKKQNNEKNH
jgi:hypothetical protein